jgi:Leucine-rich repeat (LRR) protein
LANSYPNPNTSGLDAFNCCTKLKELQLNNNKLIDSLSPSLSTLHSLELFYLQNNFLHGVVPQEICTLKTLKFLNLSQNNLNGKLPNNLGDLEKLEILIVGNNFITGPLPQSLSKLINLKDFFVFNSYPSIQIARDKRGFLRKKFEIDFILLPGMGVNCLCWDDDEIFG